jgi:branched-chain amino acid aminotransferase
MIDGQLVAPQSATISVFDRGFLYGDSVFETIRTYGGRPYALAEHLARLTRSAERVFIPNPVTDAVWQIEIEQLLAAAGNTESYLRVMLTRGQGELGLDPALAERPCRVMIAAELKPPAAQLYRQGISVVIFKTQRAADATAAEGAKIGNYLVAVLATRAAKQVGALEALIVDQAGRIVEGATSNLFYVVGGQVFTPAEQLGILAGVTRAGVLTAAEDLGISVGFSAPTLEQLQAADEVFISSSIRELLAVVAVDGAQIGSGRPGPILRALHERFRQRAVLGLGLPALTANLGYYAD